MDVLKNKTDEELLKSLLAETAKAKNEMQHGINDMQKAMGRISFVLLLINTLLEREDEKKGD